jgi:hypothetical protein
MLFLGLATGLRIDCCGEGGGVPLFGIANIGIGVPVELYCRCLLLDEGAVGGKNGEDNLVLLLLLEEGAVEGENGARGSDGEVGTFFCCCDLVDHDGGVTGDWNE